MAWCNYCSLRSIEARSAKTGKRVVQLPATGEGVNVYVVPVGISIDEDRHFAAWFMELTDHCVC